MFDASGGSLGTPFNANGSRVRATLDPMCASCYTFFDTTGCGLRTSRYCLFCFGNKGRWRPGIGLR